MMAATFLHFRPIEFLLNFHLVGWNVAMKIRMKFVAPEENETKKTPT